MVIQLLFFVLMNTTASLNIGYFSEHPVYVTKRLILIVFERKLRNIKMNRMTSKLFQRIFEEVDRNTMHLHPRRCLRNCECWGNM